MSFDTLVACGGTGAHVSLAFVRLHLLGYALGFFETRAGGKEMEFPRLFLVDQDDGSSDDKATAWQATRDLIEKHPAWYGWNGRIRLGQKPRPISITPLPVGPMNAWSNEPYDHIESRYSGSPYARMLLSREQRSIKYSRGMMASPVMGSLLFELKDYDRDEKGEYQHVDYSDLIESCKSGRIAITGSGVGGTGAAVGPTLARQCAAGGADVMAVMVLRWFDFSLAASDDNLRYKARVRNSRMAENSASGLASYGQILCQNVPTVLVGVRDRDLCTREYTTDNLQPLLNSYVHAVAALSCTHHFLAHEPYEKGLYGMSAEDSSRLTWGLKIPGGTLGDLAKRARTVEIILDTFANVLESRHSNKPWSDEPAIYTHINRITGDPSGTAKRIRELLKCYCEQIEWLSALVGEDIGISKVDLRDKYLLHGKSRARLKDVRIAPTGGKDRLDAKHAAQALFEWVAKWVKEGSKAGSAIAFRKEEGSTFGVGYWPQRRATGLTPQWGTAGSIANVPGAKVHEAVKGLVKGQRVSQNGWPHPMAAVKHFEYLIRIDDASAIKQLKILLVGLALECLELDAVADSEDGSSPSFLELIRNYRKNEFTDVAKYRVLFHNKAESTVVGFNCPQTLLCPSPDCTDEVWEEVWRCITDSEDASDWLISDEWGFRGDFARGQVNAWIEDLEKRFREVSPPWASAVGDNDVNFRSYGLGPSLAVYWGAGEAPRPVYLQLPRYEVEAQQLPENTEQISEDDFLALVPEFNEMRTRSGVCFKVEQMLVPGHDSPVKIVWRDHLSALQEADKIATWQSGDFPHPLCIVTFDQRQSVRLDNFQVIIKEDIQIPFCVPLEQRFVPGSPKNREPIRYPDLPLRLAYIGLISIENDEELIDGRLLTSNSADGANWGAMEPAGPDAIAWTLRLKGRSDRVSIEVPIASKSQAHWMIWPRFRCDDRMAPWRAYYLYQHSTQESLEVEALLSDNGNFYLASRTSQKTPGNVQALRYRATTGEQLGAPPVALVAKDGQEETGIYMVSLDPIGKGDETWRLGIDFGTSHSAVAVKCRPDMVEGEIVALEPELALDGGGRQGLTLHVSEFWVGGALPNIDLWRPTYVESRKPEATGVLPSELFSLLPLSEFTGSEICDWVPGEDCAIPVLELSRTDIANHILSGFKWDVSQPKFGSSAELLRKIYLSMVLEIALADVVWQQGIFPRLVEVTFTYPLRSSSAEIKQFERVISDLLRSSTERLGIGLRPFREGLLSESEAARGGTGKNAEIVLVGDLGGGTIDLFISATRLREQESRHVADSAKLGGNLLLDHLAQNASVYLPQSGGWQVSDPVACATQLRAWMRSRGAVQLFGEQCAGNSDRGLNLKSFEHAAQANNARKLIDRYFALIVEYMARNLVGFVGAEWQENAVAIVQDLNVTVQLRGNGWRHWYGSDDYQSIETTMKDWICAWARTLWNDCGWDVPTDAIWRSPHSEGRPKLDPICQAVGRSRDPNKAREDGFTFPLSNIQLHLPNKKLQQHLWHSELPIRVHGAVPEFTRIDPPIRLGLRDGRTLIVERFLDMVTKNINRAIQRDRFVESQGNIYVPIAALIWENCFESGELGRDLVTKATRA